MPLGRSASAATAAHDRVAAAEASCHVGALRDLGDPGDPGDCLKPGTPDPDFFSRQFLWFFGVMISDKKVSDYSLQSGYKPTFITGPSKLNRPCGK